MAQVELIGGPDDGAIHPIPDDMVGKPFYVITPLTSLAEAVSGEAPSKTVRTLRYVYAHTGQRESGIVVYQLQEVRLQD